MGKIAMLMWILPLPACGGHEKPRVQETVDAATAAPEAAAFQEEADVGETAGPFSAGSFDIKIVTSGGFAGGGLGRVAIDADGNVTAGKTGFVCKKKVDAAMYAELIALLNLHAANEWEKDYDPSNPGCCCDQFSYAVTIGFVETSTTVATRWCSASMKSVPGGAEITDKLMAIKDDVLASGECAP
jgi:hypothetical protein